MRFLNRRTASVALLSLTGLVWSGCEAKEQSEYVAGVSTQVKVPRDLQYIRLSVSVGGVQTFCRAYPVYNGRVQLPRSLGTYALNEPSAEPISYQIIGYTEKLEEGEELNEVGCGDKVGDNGARILRRTKTPYVKDEILFLPMPLKYSCYDTKCEGNDKTCKGGKCVDANVPNPADVFPKYSPELVDGTGGDCFSPTLCMSAALPAIPVNPADCTYAIPNTKDAPATINGLPNPYQLPPGAPPVGDGVNVEVTYDGGYVREILDKDPDEGFTIPDPNKPQQFRLAPGLCDLVKGTLDGTGKRITTVRVSPTCRPKLLAQPLCQADALTAMGLDPQGASTDDQDKVAGCSAVELKPPRTGLIVVIDDTKEHDTFFTGADVQAVLNIAFTDPAIYRANVGVVYSSGPAACGTTNATLALPLKPAGEQAPLIKTSIEGKAQSVPNKASGEIPRFDEGLRIAYEALQADASLFRRAVIVMGERDFAGSACVANAATQSATARATAAKPIETYVFDLAGPSADTDVFPPDADVLAAAGGTTQAVDARGSKKAAAKDGFQRVVERLATCVYDAPQNADLLPNGGTLSYADPTIPSLVRSIAHDPACTDGTQNVSGWGRGADGRIYVCGQACTDYRTTLKNVSLLNNVFGQPAPPMPVFGHKPNCGPKP